MAGLLDCAGADDPPEFEGVSPMEQAERASAAVNAREIPAKAFFFMVSMTSSDDGAH